MIEPWSAGAGEIVYCNRVERPWGSYQVLDQGEGWQVKRLTVLPKQRTSLQRHLHRHEVWTIVQGVAFSEIEGDGRHWHAGSGMTIPALTWHRIANPGLLPLEIIEVQLGSYLGEDDIERAEDDYGRVPGGESSPISPLSTASE